MSVRRGEAAASKREGTERLRQAIFGAAVAASGIVAAAILAGAVLVAGTRRSDAVS